GRGRRASKNSEPGEGIDVFVLGQHPLRNRGATAPVEAIAPGDEVALELADDTALAEREPGPLALEIMHGHVGDLEAQLAPPLQHGLVQVRHYLLLTVDRYVASRQFCDRDVLGVSGAAQIDAVVLQSLAG